MKRFLFYLFICLFVGFVYFLDPSPIQATCSFDAYDNCVGTCSCKTGWSSTCSCYEPYTGVCAANTSKCNPPPTSTPAPTTPPSCQNHCTNNYPIDCLYPANSGCANPPNQCFRVCNYSLCPYEWSCTADNNPPGCNGCTKWSTWACQSDGTETKYCEEPTECTSLAKARVPCQGPIPPPVDTPVPGSPPPCTDWVSIQVHGCSHGEWIDTPRDADCIVSSTSTTLNLSSSNATHMRFANTTTSTACSSIADGSYSASQAYGATKSWTLASGAGNKQVCVRLDNSYGNKKCGGLIQLVNPTPTPTPTRAE